MNVNKLDLSLEPTWQMDEYRMMECLYKASGGLFEEYSSSAWAIWEIARLRHRLNDLGACVDELEDKLAVERGRDEHNGYEK